MPASTKKNGDMLSALDEEQILQNLIDDYSTLKQDMIIRLRDGKISRDDFLYDVKRQIARYSKDDEMNEKVLQAFEQYILGYSRLTPLIENPLITDIHCISYNTIWIKKKGVRMPSSIEFRTREEYESFVKMVATKNQVNISNLNAIQRFVDIKTFDDCVLRFTVSTGLVNTNGEPYLTIRKTLKDFPEIPDLVEKKMMTQELADILVEKFRTGSTLVCGGNSSGKTTILNALKDTLPLDMSVLVAQQADELSNKHLKDIMFMHSLPGTGENSVTYDLEAISIAALTMDIDFFIVGEVKGSEARHLLKAAHSGQLCAATIHAPGADKGMDKIVDYALPGSNYNKKDLMRMLADSFKTVIYMDDYRVDQVYDIKYYDEEQERIIYKVVVEKGEIV